MAKKAAAKPAKPKGDKKRAEKDKAKKSASASKGTKSVKAAKPAKGAPKSEQTRRVIGEQKLRTLAKDVQRAMDRSAAEGGVAGSLISSAVKNDGLNAPAFRIAHRLARLGDRDPNKLRVLLDDLDYYRDALKLDDLAGDSLLTPREGAQDSDDEGEAETPAEPQGESVVNFPGNGEARPAA